MVNKILNEMGKNNANFIPYGIQKDGLPFFHLDNSDFAEDSDTNYTCSPYRDSKLF